MSEVMMWSAVAIALVMVATWLVSLPLRNASIVDIVWGFGFAVVAWVAFATVSDPAPRRWLLVVLTTIWGMRLAGYLAWRNLGKDEDYRYQAMRKKAGDGFWWVSLLRVFLAQGAIMWVVSLPVQAGQALSQRPLGWLDWLGVAAWSVGVFFESVGDFQLARFKADPDNEGQVMDGGLWRYTRHPNYFGDFMVWWGLYAISLSTGGWWTVIGPAAMTVLLMKVSGVDLLEKSIGKRRPGYDEYIRRTNAFFPGPPRNHDA